MKNNSNITDAAGWIFGIIVFILGILNLVLVHPVPGIAYIVLSLIYFPPVDVLLHQKAGFTIPRAVKIILGFVIIWFTVGISDLAEIFGL
jgi:hypothetical protein